jgi:hypothetical protein
MFFNKCKYTDIVNLKKAAKLDVVSLNDSSGSIWFGGFMPFADITEEPAIGCVCATINKSTVRFRGDYVLPEFRKSGIYETLFNMRYNTLASLGYKRATAYCTSSSINVYSKAGFKIKSTKQIKHGNDKIDIFFVEGVLSCQ